MTLGVMVSSWSVPLLSVRLDRFGLAGILRLRERELLASIDFSAVLMQGMPSMRLFAGALHVDLAELRRYRWQVALLAFIGTALSTVIIGVAMGGVLPWLGLDIPLPDCLLFGALISPTDAIAVIGMLESAGAPANLEG